MDSFFYAVRTGLEPATLGVTGRYSNRLNYRTNFFCNPSKNAIFKKLCKDMFSFFSCNTKA
jgi:hypothetical protein